jgi:hypothetical protein
MKGNDTITTNKEVGMSNCAYEVEGPPLSICFPFILDKMW